MCDTLVAVACIKETVRYLFLKCSRDDEHYCHEISRCTGTAVVRIAVHCRWSRSVSAHHYYRRSRIREETIKWVLYARYERRDGVYVRFSFYADEFFSLQCLNSTLQTSRGTIYTECKCIVKDWLTLAGGVYPYLPMAQLSHDQFLEGVLF